MSPLLLLLLLPLFAGSAAAGAEPPEPPAWLSGLDFEAEAWCADGGDVFVSDGEGWLLQYWRTAAGLVPVRTLATNPDVEHCVVSSGHVYFLDPAIGVMAYRRSPETDPVMQAVYLPPPQGTGRFVPVGISLGESDRSGLRVEGPGGAVEEVPLIPFAPVQAAAVSPDAETATSTRRGDSVDDPVVVASPDGAVAWILGADKQTGLRVIDLEGRQVQVLEVGKLNNVDALPAADGGYLVAASNRTTPAINLFHADPAAGTVALRGSIPLDFEEPYGLCMAEIDGVRGVFVGDKTGVVEQWALGPGYEGRRVASWRFDSLTEGCVVDPDSGTLYVGEEAAGVWAVDIHSGRKTLLDRTGAGWLVADIEGLDIHRGTGGKYLLASSQGDDSFVVYALPAGRPLLKFAIVADRERGIDGVSETDGLAAAAGPLPGFPAGILVVQDGHNVAPAANQNFKIVDWRKLEDLLQTSPPLVSGD